MTKQNLETQIERENLVLFVDDQWGREDDPMIPGLYGKGKVPGYKFLLEDACVGDSLRDYSVRKVLERVEKEGPDLILLDMDFGYLKGFGENILYGLKKKYPQIPVIIDSSSENEELKQRCLAKGARAWVNKTPCAEEMKIILDEVMNGVKGGKK